MRGARPIRRRLVEGPAAVLAGVLLGGLLAGLAPATARACSGCANAVGSGPYLAATAILLLVPVGMTAVFVAWIRHASARADDDPTARATVRRVEGVAGTVGLQALLLSSLVTLC